MKSELPKVLVPVCGRPMIDYVLDALERAGIDQTVVFGSALHVSGSDHAALEAAVKQSTEGTALRAERIETGLEDVFISLMAHSTDNYGAPS